MKKKILVTGSLGYIGTVLTKYLIDAGYQCIGFDIGFFRDCKLYSYEDTETIFGDMREFDEKLLEGVDAVVHLAAITNDPLEDLDAKTVYEPTRAYAVALARLCKKKNIQFIYSSSSSIYGISTKEDFLNEDAEKHPQTPYSENKWLVENDILPLADDKFHPIFLRYATVFGMSPRIRLCVFLNMFTGMAFTEKKIILNSDGQAWRPNVHILDVCEAIRRSIEHKGNGALALNVGARNLNYTVTQVAEIIRDQIPGCKIEYRTGEKKIKKDDIAYDKKIHDGVDKRTYRLDFDRIESVFPKYQCQWNLEKGIQDMIDTFEKVKLTKEKFQDIRFYRLRWLEYLKKKSQLTDKLRIK